MAMLRLRCIEGTIMHKNTLAPQYKLSKRKDRGTWEISYYIDGQRHRRSLGKISKWMAEQKLKQMQTEALLGKPEKLFRHSSNLDSFLKRFFDWSRDVKHKNERSIVTDKTAIKQFLKYVQVVDLREINSESVSNCIAGMKKDGYKPGTINIVLRTWRNLFNRAIDWNCVITNPFQGIKQIKVPEKPNRFCSASERDAFMAVAEAKGRNIHIVCALGFYAGLRKKEISYARWEWFDFTNDLIRVEAYEDFETKSKRSRTLPFSSKLREILEKYRDGKKNGFVFDNATGSKEYHYYFRKVFDRVRKESNLDWVTPHIMRHTFGSLLAQQGVSLYKIGKWMGHSHTRVTELYAHLQAQDDDIERL